MGTVLHGRAIVIQSMIALKAGLDRKGVEVSGLEVVNEGRSKGQLCAVLLVSVCF
ncbi:unnamed protein product, partial [Staurois parvus]